MSKTSKKLLLISGACAVMFVILRYGIVVRQVLCTVANEDTRCPEHIQSKLQSVLGKPLLFSLLPESAEQSLSDEPFSISGYTRELPATFRVELMPAEYEYGLLIGNRSLIVTTDNMILERPPVADLPLVTISESIIPPGTMPSHEVLTVSASVLSVLHTQAIKFDNIEYLSRQELRIYVQSPQLTVIVDPQNSEEQLSLIPVLLHSPQIQEIPEPLEELDLRFKMPVIRTKQTM